MTFLGGLLHNAGKVLVLRNLSHLRKQHPGVEVGPYLKDRLMNELYVPLGLYYGLHRGLAKEVRDVIVYHQRPTEAPESTRDAVLIVAIANGLASSPLPLGGDLVLRSTAAGLQLSPEEGSVGDMLKAGAQVLQELRRPE